MTQPLPAAADRPSAAALQAELDAPYAEVRDRVRALLEHPDMAPGDGLPTAEHRERVLHQARLLAQAGGAGLGYPVAHGGEGDVGASVAAFEILGWGDLSLLVKSGVQFGLFGGAVLHLGTDRHHALLPEILRLDLPGCFAMTETGHGSDVQSLRTTATFDPARDEFVVTTPEESARKDYIGNAARHGRMAAVFAQLVTGGEHHGVHCFLVPIRDADGTPCPGVRIADCGDKLGLGGVDNGRLWFDDVRIPRSSLLDRFAAVDADGTYASPIASPARRFFTMLGTLVQGRASVAGAAIATAEKALAIAVRYGEQRRQFTVPGGDEEVLLLDYRMHQRRLLVPLAATYALHLAQAELRDLLGRTFADPDTTHDDQQDVEARAAGIKALATWHALDTIQVCREACGGAGYLAENRFGPMRDDIDVFTTFEGDNTVLLQLVAKTLLTDHRDEFGELDAIGTVRYVAGQVVGTLLERTAVRPLLQTLEDVLRRGEDDTDLTDPRYHLGLLASREEHLLSGVARRLKDGADAGLDPFTVFNDCQDHLLAAARAHVERVVLETFGRRAAEASDAGVRALLQRLCCLHGLAVIEADRGWFLEHGRLSGARSKAVIGAVNRLCAEIRPDARLLVDAFGIPDAAIGAPIAFTTVP